MKRKVPSDRNNKASEKILGEVLPIIDSSQPKTVPVRATDRAYLKFVEKPLSEWASDEDAAAFDRLASSR